MVQFILITLAKIYKTKFNQFESIVWMITDFKHLILSAILTNDLNN